MYCVSALAVRFKGEFDLWTYGLGLGLEGLRVKVWPWLHHCSDPSSIVHSKLDYGTAVLSHSLPNCQLNRLQQIQNSLARAVVKAPKSTHITPILESLHWLKVKERIEYKLLALTLRTKFLQQVNLTLFTAWTPFNPLAVPAPHLWLYPFSPVTYQHKSLHHVVFGINFHIHSST